MAAKKKKKKAVKKAASRAKKTVRKPAARKTAARKSAAKKPAKRPAKIKAKAKTTAHKPAKTPSREFGEGNYKASKRFRESEEKFVKANRAKIPALGKAAEAALEGPEGKELMAAEAQARSHGAEG